MGSPTGVLTFGSTEHRLSDLKRDQTCRTWGSVDGAVLRVRRRSTKGGLRMTLVHRKPFALAQWGTLFVRFLRRIVESRPLCQVRPLCPPEFQTRRLAKKLTSRRSLLTPQQNPKMKPTSKSVKLITLPYLGLPLRKIHPLLD